MSQYTAKAQATRGLWGFEVMCEPDQAELAIRRIHDALDALEGTEGLKPRMYSDSLFYLEACDEVYRTTELFRLFGDQPTRMTVPLVGGTVALDVTDHG